MHWTLILVGAVAAGAVVLELEIFRRLGALARRLDGIDLEVQTLRVRVRAITDLAGIGAALGLSPGGATGAAPGTGGAGDPGAVAETAAAPER